MVNCKGKTPKPKRLSTRHIGRPFVHANVEKPLAVNRPKAFFNFVKRIYKLHWPPDYDYSTPLFDTWTAIEDKHLNKETTASNDENAEEEVSRLFLNV